VELKKDALNRSDTTVTAFCSLRKVPFLFHRSQRNLHNLHGMGSEC